MWEPSYVARVGLEDDAEAQLAEIGLRIDEFDFGREDEPDVIGLVTVEWLDLDHKEYMARMLIRPGTPADRRASFARWCRDMILRWVSSGPEVDGWQRRESDAGWQLWCRLRYLPSLD
jgi:hypothetical protein